MVNSPCLRINVVTGAKVYICSSLRDRQCVVMIISP